MAQVSIREYDAKKMLSDYTSIPYSGVLIREEKDFEKLEKNSEKRYIIKPDQLFGKRGKYGLVGVNLDTEGLKKWWQEKNNTTVTIGKKSGILDTFLIEDFVPHTDEYYVAIKTERTGDVLYFSDKWWVDVEENWDSVHEFELPIAKSEDESVFPYEAFAKLGFEKDSKIVNFLEKLHAFFIDYGFSYLEVNPFTFDKNDTIVCLDMVARVDSCEAFKQKNTWKDLEFPGGFGDKKTESEKYIEKLDSETGASLKLTILSPNGKIWLLTSGGGASVAIADTLGDMGLAQDIANYGECSGNPDRENTRAYTETLLKNLIANGHKNQYLLIAGAIANFTHIDKTFSGIIDALEKYQKELRENKTTILVRRGGINDKKWLELMKHAAEKLGIPCEIADGNVYMTDILSHIKL